MPFNSDIFTNLVKYISLRLCWISCISILPKITIFARNDGYEPRLSITLENITSKTWPSTMYYVVRIVNLFKCLESSTSLFISRYFITDLNYNAACIFNLGTWGSLLKQHHCGKTFFEYIEPIINNLEILPVKRCNF